jgi:ribosomal protein S18 acetylase RimI-like enzyme
MTTPHKPVRFEETSASVNWCALKERLREDLFDNGRSPDQLQMSFERSFAAVFAYHGTEIIGTARVLSDGVCNAYLIDVWTHTPFRRMGIASAMVSILEKRLQGQHLALFTEDALAFYLANGFAEERVGMSKVIGRWLSNDA